MTTTLASAPPEGARCLDVGAVTGLDLDVDLGRHALYSLHVPAGGHRDLAAAPARATVRYPPLMGDTSAR